MDGDFGKDNLENFFKKNLGSHEEEPGEGVWEGISGQLGSKSARTWTAGLKNGLFKHGLTAALTAVLIFWLFSWKSGQQDIKFSHQLATLHEQVVTDREVNQSLNQNLYKLNQLLEMGKYQQEDLGDALSLAQVESSMQKELILDLYSKLYETQEMRLSSLLARQKHNTGPELSNELNTAESQGSFINQTKPATGADKAISNYGDGLGNETESLPFKKDKEEGFASFGKRLKNGIGLSSGMAGSYSEFGDGGYNLHGGIQYKREVSKYVALSLGASYRWQQYNVDGSNEDVNEALSESSSKIISNQSLIEPRFGEVQDVEKTTDQLKFPVTAMVYVNPEHKAKFFVHSGWAPYVLITQDYLLDYNVTDGAANEQFQDRVYAEKVSFDVGSWRNGAGVEWNVFNKTQMQLMLYHDLGISREGTEGSRLNNVGFSANWYLARF